LIKLNVFSLNRKHLGIGSITAVSSLEISRPQIPHFPIVQIQKGIEEGRLKKIKSAEQFDVVRLACAEGSAVGVMKAMKELVH